MILIFDCDGVIFDTNQVKNLAFEEALARHGFAADVVSEFIAYHKRNGGISRYAKFEYLLESLAPGVGSPGLLEQLLEDFGSACRQGYDHASFTENAPATLKRLALKHTAYVASGSDQEELRGVFQRRGLAEAFRQIYGSPTPKTEIIAEIVRQHGLDSGVLMVGDSTKDYEAAAFHGVPCVLMPTYADDPDGVAALVRQKGVPTITSLEELFDLDLGLS